MYIMHVYGYPSVFIKTKYHDIILYTPLAEKALQFSSRINALRFAEDAGIISEITIIEYKPHTNEHHSHSNPNHTNRRQSFN